MAESLPWSAHDLDAENVTLLPLFVYLSVSFSSTKGYVNLRSKLRGIIRELFALQVFSVSICYMSPCLFHPFLVSKL